MMPSGSRRLDSGEGAGAAATQKLNQHPLGDVVTMVAGGDGVEVVILLEVDKGAIAEAPPGSFASGGQWCPSFDSQEVEGTPSLGTEGLAE